jgi:chemotaxis protein methyltransferase CheR
MPDEVILGWFSKYIERELGIIYSAENFFQLQNRLSDTATLFGCASVEELYQTALKGITAPMKQLLLDVATNNETSFFRDPKVFRAIEKVVIPALLARPGATSRLSIWSAASSSGQEALSVAMTLCEWREKSGQPLEFGITGTDVSERILARARAARYTQLEIQRGLPAAMMLKYFGKDERDADGCWSAGPKLTRHICYGRQNLTATLDFPAPFDLVLCRNVLIYQNVERKAEILARIHAQIAPGGFLILGAAESMIGITDAFRSEIAEGAVIFRKKEDA